MMALGFEKQIIECSKLKKCGEITTMLSVGKKEFFLNCEFCDYSFLQLENFMQHMCEDHIVEINQPKVEEEDNEIDQYDEEIDDLEECLNSVKNLEEADDDDDYNMRDFERVEIELDTSDIKRSIDIKGEVTPKDFVNEDSMENENFKIDESHEVTEHEYKSSSDLDYEESYNLEENETKPTENSKEMKASNCDAKRRFIIELIEVYHSCSALWDSKCDSYTDRLVRNQQYDILLEKYKEKYPNATKDDVRQKIFRLRTTFRRESKRISAFEKSTLYYFDAMTFLLDNEKREEYIERRNLERSEIAALMTMDYKKEEIKCGEISALLSAGNQQFFLNCVFCEYTFLQLEKFIHHMCEDHFPKMNNQNFKDIDKHSFTKTEKIDMSADKMDLEDDDENGCYLNGFERVEIELDSENISNEIDKDAAIPEECGDGFSEDNNSFEESVDIDYFDNAPDKIGNAGIYINEQVDDLKNLFQTTKMTDIFSSYAKHPALWDKRIRQPTKKEKENLLKNIASSVGMPEEWKNIQKLVAKFRFKLRTEIIRMQIYEAKGREYTPAWLTDLKSFIKQKPRVQKQTQKTKSVEIKKTILTPPLLTDDQYIALAELYKKYPCLWDENDITYRFSNRRRDALECIHNDFNLETGLCMTQKDLESEIAKLRKICSDEKKQKLRCKRNKIAYKSPYSYYDHIAFIEVNVAPYECSICGEILSSLGQYKIHLSTHNGSLPYKCHICDHEFKIAANLTVHLRRHVHDFTYNCEICNKSCATSTDLKIHIRSHTGENPYFCDICGKRLRTASVFSTHMRRHQNRPCYNCELCDKPFFKKGLLKEHMNVHMKVKDKICNVCNKGFTSAKQLRQHKYIHDKEKKFVCKICTKRFAQHAGLSGHMKSHGTSLANVNKSLIYKPINS
nr:uncharacterized protein LOC106621121 [Bactrocera oleae]